MTGFANIIKSNIVTSEYDEFWNDIAPLVSGKSARPILVIVSEFKDPTEELQLNKMLEGSKLTKTLYNIVQLQDGQQVAWHRLRNQLQPGFVFLLGILPVQLGISALFQINEPNRFDGAVWLPTYSLKEIDLHADMKKQLWLNGMKPIFVDKMYGGF